MDVSVIIVNYNTRQMTAECIDSIIDKTAGVEYEIILVDNGSTDGSKEFFEKDSRIKYIYSNENLGFGRANNLGYQYASGRYIFLLNSDTLLVNNAIKGFFDYAEQSDSATGCFGTVLWDNNHDQIHSCAQFPTCSFMIKKYLNNYTRRLGVDLLKKYYNHIPADLPSKVDYITGADLFIKKHIIDNNGLFNSNFFMYYEETELQYRYFRKGYKAVLLESPQIIHLCGKSQKRKSLFGWMNEIQSSLIYSKLVFSPFKYHIIRFMSIILLTPIIGVFPTNFKNKSEVMKKFAGRIKLKTL